MGITAAPIIGKPLIVGEYGARDGLTAIFYTRREADLAIEHLVQEMGIDRSIIFVEPNGPDNSSGVVTGGADAEAGDPGTAERRDGPLKGGIKLSVGVSCLDRPAVERVLLEAGACEIRSG